MSPKVSIPSAKKSIETRRVEKRKVKEKLMTISLKAFTQWWVQWEIFLTTTTKGEEKKEIMDNENNCKRLQAQDSLIKVK